MNRDLIEYMKKIDKLPHGEKRTKLIDRLYRQMENEKRRNEMRIQKAKARRL